MLQHADHTLTKLRQLIASGGLGAGGRIPPERTLANEMGVGRRSLRRALEILEQEGQITRHQGRGTFVQDKSAPVAAAHRAAPPRRRSRGRLGDVGDPVRPHPGIHQSAGSDRGPPGGRAGDRAPRRLARFPVRHPPPAERWSARPGKRPIPPTTRRPTRRSTARSPRLRAMRCSCRCSTPSAPAGATPPGGGSARTPIASSASRCTAPRTRRSTRRSPRATASAPSSACIAI